MIITGALNQVDTVCKEFVFNGYNALASTYGAAITGLVCLSIIVLGYAAVQGYVTIGLKEVSKRALVIGFIMTFALSWGIFSKYIYTFFNYAPNEIATHIVKSIPGSSIGDTGSVGSSLESAFNAGIGFGKSLMDRATFKKPSPLIWALFTWLAVFVMTVVALVDLVIAKFGMAIFLVLAPITIPLYLFNTTKSAVFDGWLRFLVTFALIPIFVIAALALGLELMHDAQTKLANALQNGELASLTLVIPYELYVLVTVGLLLKATQYAAATAGNIAAGMSSAATPLMGALAGYIARGPVSSPQRGNADKGNSSATPSSDYNFTMPNVNTGSNVNVPQLPNNQPRLPGS